MLRLIYHRLGSDLQRGAAAPLCKSLGGRLVIALGVTDPNSAQSMKIVIDKLQDFFMTFARIAEQFTDLECGKTLV